MNKMERALERYLATEELDVISKKTVGIAGCGGLGSNTANNLVRLGFKNFVLVDFDRVEPSNLNRQFFFYDQIGLEKTVALSDNLKRINPSITIELHTTRLTADNISEIFEHCDLLVEAFDNVEGKKMIIEEFVGKKPLVSASGLGNYWSVDSITTREITPIFTMVGDFTSDTDSGISPLSPGVQIGAAKETAAILKFVLTGSSLTKEEKVV